MRDYSTAIIVLALAAAATLTYADEQKGDGMYKEIMADLYKKVQTTIRQQCSGKTTYDSDTEQVLCTGNLEIIGFPCIDCQNQIDWHDYDSVKRCAKDSLCYQNGLQVDVTGFTGTVDFVGQKPQLHTGAVYINEGKTEDFQEFLYQEEEDRSFTLTLHEGMKMDYKVSVEASIEGLGKLSESFELALDFSVTASQQVIRKQTWSAKQHVTQAPYTRTKLDCFLWSDQYKSHYTLHVKPSGPVLIVIWNKDGTEYHPYYVYFAEDSDFARMEYWYPEGFTYKATIEGLQGVEVVCNKTITELHKNSPDTFSTFTLLP